MVLLWAAAFVALPLLAAERRFDFGEYSFDRPPPGFHSTVAGQGKPGEWKVILDDIPPPMAPITSNAPAVSKRAVLAQVARDPTGDHFPMLIFDGDTYGDFTLTTRFKTVGGAISQMAGLVFRFQDEKNFYVLLASSLDNRFLFYKVVNGVRGPLIGPQTPVPRGEWHELTVQCAGNQIHCLLDGRELIPMMTDTSFTSGKIGFWTKSDSVSYFTDTRITYATREMPARMLVAEALKKYPRLLDLRIYAAAPGKAVAVVASKEEKEIGQPGGESEQDVIRRGTSYFGRAKGSVSVTAPLRDRNGDPIAAVRVILKSFPGETEDTAVGRAQPVVKEMQSRIRSLDDLLH